MSCGHVDKYRRKWMENGVDTYYKIDWQAVKIVPVKLDKDGLDDGLHPYDKGMHHSTENDAIKVMKTECRRRVLEADKVLMEAIQQHSAADHAYEQAIKLNALCLERYSFADTHIE